MSFQKGRFSAFLSLAADARWPKPVDLARGCLFVVCYVACVWLSHLLADRETLMMPVYPAAGLAVAALLHYGVRKFFPWVAAAVVASSLGEGHFGWYYMVSAGNFTAIMLAAWLTERFARGRHFLQRPEDVFRFAAAAALLGIISATVGGSVLIGRGETTLTAFWRHGVGWAVGDLVGVLLIVPPLLAWNEEGLAFRRRGSLEFAETLLLFAGSMTVVQFAFGSWPFMQHAYALEYLTLPLLLWSAFRFPRRGGVTLLLLVAAQAIANTFAGYGSFANHPHSALALLQVYLGAVSMIVLVVSAGVRRHEAQEAVLRQAFAEAENARLAAENADRAKSKFLSRMSHELRTPLNAILGFGQILQMQPGQDEVLQECSDHIVRSGRHLLGLINEVMDIASLQDQRLTLALEPVELPLVVRECFDSLAEESRARRVSCHLDFPSMDGVAAYVADAGNPAAAPGACVALADKRRLSQVLRHLIANAIHYNVDGGRVNVTCIPANDEHATAAAAAAADQNTGRGWQIRVSDTGQGISAEDQKRLFTPFERLGAESMGRPGTGLGLTLSRSLIEAMAGRFGVESAPGSGSTFWVELPAAL